MAEMSSLLPVLKLELIISSAAYNDLLQQKIEAAKDMIVREGAALPDTEEDYTAEDRELVVGYAAYLYRRSKSDDAEFPRWLRWSLNNRVFHDKTGGESSG